MEPGQEVLLSQRKLGLPGAGALVGQEEAHGGHRLLQARLLAAVAASQGLSVPPPAPGLPACHCQCEAAPDWLIVEEGAHHAQPVLKGVSETEVTARHERAQLPFAMDPQSAPCQYRAAKLSMS